MIGPDKLPSLARDAARMLRGLREMATGARTQLRDELGPEFADLDLRSLNPARRSSGCSSGMQDLSELNPRATLRDAMSDEPPTTGAPAPPPGQRPLGRGESAVDDDDAILARHLASSHRTEFDLGRPRAIPGRTIWCDQLSCAPSRTAPRMARGSRSRVPPTGFVPAKRPAR